MKLLSASQIRALDAYTIQQEPISSIQLMERASRVFVDWFCELYDSEEFSISIFCGPGNNGGDGLAIARLLNNRSYRVNVYLCQISSVVSEDFEANLRQLPGRGAIPIHTISKDDDFPVFSKATVLVDGIFGSGLNRPISGYWAQLILNLNQQKAMRVAIDIPSGLYADRHSDGVTFQAERTLSFELPKLAFLFPENAQAVGNWEFRSIGLNQDFIHEAKSDNYYLSREYASRLVNPRNKFDHKGSYGHALIIAGSLGKTGAAVLAARACLRTGVGLLSVHIPQSSYQIIQIAVPEAMSLIDPHNACFSSPPEIKPYKSIGIGCGIGTAAPTRQAFEQLLQQSTQPLVLDADALNILAAQKSLLSLIPENSILTPHPGEFKRLFGESNDDFDRNHKQREWALQLKSFIILKGAHTCIACPDGRCFFNSTGNPGMATAGSGDVLTGIITSLLAQSYEPEAAALLGVYLHGLAGDIAADKMSCQAMIAGDIIDSLGAAWKELT